MSKEAKNQEQNKKQDKSKKDRKAAKHMHWADQIALAVKERVEQDPELQKVVAEHGYFVYDEKTPSGTIHVGSGRGWVIHEVLAKAMRKIGLNARFVLSSDDMDPFDKPNKELGSDWDKYLGMPFRNIPSPVEGYDSFGDYFFKQCTEKFAELGIVADLESTGGEYVKGTFNAAIKKCLDDHEKIWDIFKRFYGDDVEAAKKIPFNPICEKCGKIATTYALSWDKEKELVSYECRDISYTKGCGHKGETSPYNGGGKLPWKVEWAAKWPSKGVICEYAGKDHFTKGGARSVSITISDEVLNYMPPYPSTRKYTGKGYEFFNIGGKKMSTSKGRGVAFKDITSMLPPHIVRFLLIRPRPNSVIDFDPDRDNDMIYLFDRYDQVERVFFGEEKVSEKDEGTLKRIYELSHIGELPKKMPVQVPFRFAAIVIQIGLDVDGALDILKKMKHIPEELSEDDVRSITQRLNDAKSWVDKYASDDYKFALQEKVEVSVDAKTKEALTQVLAFLEANQNVTDKELHDKFYEIVKGLELETKQFFKESYQVLIGKEKGPQLANFILTIGAEKLKKLVDQL